MKKNALKKLSLHKETVRNLTDEKLGEVGGALPVSTQYSVCPQSCGIACTVITCRNCQEA